MSGDHLADILMPGIRGKMGQLEHLVEYLQNIPVAIRSHLGWKPIDTAPETGDMLLWDGQFIHIGKRHAEYDCFYAYDQAPPQCYPTHWMPLPKPPGDKVSD